MCILVFGWNLKRSHTKIFFFFFGSSLLFDNLPYSANVATSVWFLPYQLMETHGTTLHLNQECVPANRLRSLFGSSHVFSSREIMILCCLLYNIWKYSSYILSHFTIAQLGRITWVSVISSWAEVELVHGQEQKFYLMTVFELLCFY